MDHGEFCTFVGPSGCGKTTILRMINQLDIPDSGDVYIQGVRLADADIIQIRRQIGFVMQSAALFPIVPWRKISRPCRGWRAGAKHGSARGLTNWWR
ncbi:ATP-binding cassette domain-containing protein [Klebsiella variicola subsp. variicola]|nr:ATP-binding cassette domain-containing protein [Klebsiella variicola subsp. variicola]